MLHDNIEGYPALVHYMNRVEAKHIVSLVMKLYLEKDVSNFEKVYSEDMICHLNSETLNLEGLRLRVVYLLENFDIFDLSLNNMVYEKNKAAFHFHLKMKRLEDQKEFEDDVLYLYHFEKNQIKESWAIFKLPLSFKVPNENV